ncbi:MAG TPA: zinc ABC transporter substrate-binding protein [Gammaproteobacteria bacterium]|nr:zinc ABC transporter substrate-binding protein [Gammaproteobacteria bacterium]
MNFRKCQIILFLLGCLIPSAAFAKLDILACEPEWQSLAELLGGDKVDVKSATTAFQDPHHIEARPSLIVKTRNSDLIFCTGAELEIGWLPLLLTKSSNYRIQKNQLGYFLASDQVELIEKPATLDRSQGDVHIAGNPHVHWDPYRVLKIAAAFSKRLRKIDAANSEYYQQRNSEFVSRWGSSIKKWESLAAPLRGKKVIVYHKNWSYLLNWLEIEVTGDLEPKPGIPPTSAHLASLLSHTKYKKPDVILIANYQDNKGAQWLGEKSGVPILELPFTVGGSEAADSLFTLYEDALSKLKQIR